MGLQRNSTSWYSRFKEAVVRCVASLRDPDVICQLIMTTILILSAGYFASIATTRSSDDIAIALSFVLLYLIWTDLPPTV